LHQFLIKMEKKNPNHDESINLAKDLSNQVRINTVENISS
jgi:hypothetical protein